MIGIIGAMDIEVDILKAKMENPETTSVSGIEFVSGTLFGRSAVVAKCGVGKVNAALCTEAMIIKFSPDLIINTGIAGALTSELSVLDVVVAKAVVQHDFNVSIFNYPKGKIPGVEEIRIPTDGAISLAIEGIVRGLGINCRYGIIASGDQFISEDGQKEEISKEFSALACEMEGASIGQVCFLNKIPFTVIRAISDSSDGGGMDYDTFAEKAASRSAKIVEEFIMSI